MQLSKAGWKVQTLTDSAPLLSKYRIIVLNQYRCDQKELKSEHTMIETSCMNMEVSDKRTKAI
jgi:hypothetical protein